MCFSKPPKPERAPAPPDPNMATLAAVGEMRANAAKQSTSSNMLSRLRDEDVAASSRKVKLGQ